MPFPRYAGTEPPVASRCRRPPGVRTEPGIPPSCRSRLVRAVPRAPALSGLAPPGGGNAPADVREGGNPGLPPPCGRIARAGADPRAGRAVALAGTAHSSCGRRFPRHGRHIPRAASSAIRLGVAQAVRSSSRSGSSGANRSDRPGPQARRMGRSRSRHGGCLLPEGAGIHRSGAAPIPRPPGSPHPGKTARERRRTDEPVRVAASRPGNGESRRQAGIGVATPVMGTIIVGPDGGCRDAFAAGIPARRRGHHACRFRHDFHSAPLGGCRAVPGCRRGDRRREP